MKIRKLDANGDWTFGKGLANYAVDEAAVEENVSTRLKSWVGDCFFSLDDFVDWKNRLDAGQQANLTTELKGVILQSFGVVGINSIFARFDPQSRGFAVTYDIQTIFSPSFQRTLQVAAGLAGS